MTVKTQDQFSFNINATKQLEDVSVQLHFQKQDSESKTLNENVVQVNSEKKPFDDPYLENKLMEFITNPILSDLIPELSTNGSGKDLLNTFFEEGLPVTVLLSIKSGYRVP